MAVTKTHPIKSTLKAAIDYICNPDKTDGDVYKRQPWKKKKLQFYSEDVSGQVHLALANGIYVEKENLQPRLQNTLRRMAAYSNPQYYKNHAMGFSNRDNPRIVACFEELIR